MIWKCMNCGDEIKTEEFVVMVICSGCMNEMKQLNEVKDGRKD